MSSLLDTNNRIKSVESTMKITKAMKLVATAKLRGARLRYEDSLKYAESVEHIIDNLVLIPGAKKFTSVRDEGKDLYIMIGSELGLCGGYNTSMFKMVEDFKDALFITLGKKAISYFHHREQYEVILEKAGVTDNPLLEKIKDVGDLTFDLYLNNKVKSVNLVYTRYVNSVSFQPTIKQIFPLQTNKKFGRFIEFEPEEEELLKSGLPRYVDASILIALKESLVSEYASRRLAMDSATDNAGELIDSLLVEKNRVRQAKITQEISEIVSGSEAL